VIQAGSISQQGPSGFLHNAATFLLRDTPEASPALPSIYVLDMGDPVRILDLAMRFASLHGYQPRLTTRDGQPFPGSPMIEPSSGPLSDQPTMDIAITGVRPGEKLHEELVYAAEALTPTDYPGVLALAPLAPAPPVAQVPLDVPAMIADLASLQRTHDPALVRAALRRYLPEYAESTGAGKTNPGTFQDTNVPGRNPGVTQNAA
jgi:O-antigen biosynthesis protein WbqV